MYVKAGQYKCICNWYSMLMVATINLQIQLTMIKLSEKKLKDIGPIEASGINPKSEVAVFTMWGFVKCTTFEKMIIFVLSFLI